MRNHCALGLSLLTAGVVLGQSTTLLENATAPTSGADLAAFDRGFSHFTYDLRIDTTAEPADWTATEFSVDVIGTGRIWHASDETNFGPPLLNLNVPFLDASSTDTKAFDTFITGPGSAFFTQATLAAPGGIISDDVKIRGLNGQGVEIPLAWFDTPQNPAGENFIGSRLTFETPASFGPGDLSLDPSGREPFATITGRSATGTNPGGTAFSFTIYQAGDCNDNEIGDVYEIDQGFARDFNNNGQPDECDATLAVTCNILGTVRAVISGAEPGTQVTFQLDGGTSQTRTVRNNGTATARFSAAGSGPHHVDATHADGWSKAGDTTCR